MIQRSIEVCGITTTNPWLVHKDDCLKTIMANTVVDSDRKTKAKHFLFNFFIQYSLVFVPLY